jgi:RimJ/RimL family protein N-acetyltransferase
MQLSQIYRILGRHPDAIAVRVDWGMNPEELVEIDRDEYRIRYRIRLETPRCVLRPLIAEDVEWLTDLWADREVNRFLREESESREEARSIAKAMLYLDRGLCHFGHWAIQDKDSGIMHGWVALRKLHGWSGPSDEIAVSYILRPASWGQGLATEVAGRLLRYGFEIHHLKRVMAVVDARNTGSKRVLEKIGMQFVKSGLDENDKELLYYRIHAREENIMTPH